MESEGLCGEKLHWLQLVNCYSNWTVASVQCQCHGNRNKFYEKRLFMWSACSLPQVPAGRHHILWYPSISTRADLPAGTVSLMTSLSCHMIPFGGHITSLRYHMFPFWGHMIPLVGHMTWVSRPHSCWASVATRTYATTTHCAATRGTSIAPTQSLPSTTSSATLGTSYWVCWSSYWPIGGGCIMCLPCDIEGILMNGVSVMSCDRHVMQN